MARPQAENGHIDIANEIAEKLAKVELSSYETRILWVIWRQTYGWHKKEDIISLDRFKAMTGMHKSHIVRTLTRLVLREIITRSGKKCAFQKDYDRWGEPISDFFTSLGKTYFITRSGNTFTRSGNSITRSGKIDWLKLKSEKGKRSPKETSSKETSSKETCIEKSQPQLSETKEESEALDRIMHHYNKAYPELPKLAGRQIVAWRGRARDWFHVGIFSGLSEDEIHERIDKCPVPKHFEILPREVIDKAKRTTRQSKERTGEIDRLLSKYEEYEQTAVDAREGKERARSWRKRRNK